MARITSFIEPYGSRLITTPAFAIAILLGGAAKASPLEVPFSTIAVYDNSTETGTIVISLSNPLDTAMYRGIASNLAGGASINDSGTIVFNANLISDNGPVETVLTSTLGTPGVAAGGIGIGSLARTRGPIITNDGSIVWNSYRSGSTSASEIGVNIDGMVTYITQSRGPIGNTGFTFGSTGFLGPGTSALAPGASISHIVFRAVATDDDYYCSRPGVCYSGDSEYATILYDRTTNEYTILLRNPENPATQSSRFVDMLDNVDVNDFGTLAFMGRFNPPGNDPPGFSGLYPADTVWAIAVGSDLSTARVSAQGGTIAPGTGGRHFETGNAFSVGTTAGPALNNLDQIAYKAPLTGGRANLLIDGVFFDDGNVVRSLAIWQDDAPGGSEFGNFGNVQISDTGQVAFTAGSDSTVNRDDEVLYATNQLGVLLRVLSAGDMLEIELPDGSLGEKEILRVDLGYERENNFNASGVLATSVIFADGSNALLAIDLGYSCLPGDYNCDGYVDELDISLVLSNWGTGDLPQDWLAFNQFDGYISTNDLNVVLRNWNIGVPPASSVPEPMSGFLFFCLSFIAFRRPMRTIAA